MKMKRVSTLFFVFVLMVTMVTPAFATEITESLHRQELERYAYMDLEKANATLEAKILEARSEIIMNTSWVADGVRGYIVDENDNIVREVPQFHKVFPADWDIPVFEDDNMDVMSMATPRANNGYWDPLQFDLYLENPSATQNTRPFTHFVTRGFVGTANEYSITKVQTGGTCCNRELNNPTYNIGYSNYNTGASLGLSTRMTESQSFTIEPPLGVDVAIRASTFSTPADWVIDVGRYRVDAE